MGKITIYCGRHVMLSSMFGKFEILIINKNDKKTKKIKL